MRNFVPEVSRRSFLMAAGQAALWAGLPHSVAAAIPGLRQIAESRGLMFGAMIRGTWLATDPAYAEMCARECDLFVSRAVHWSYVEPKRGANDFKQADADLAWATAHKMKFRGHALVWRTELPPWFKEIEDKADAKRALTSHITRVCRHFAGRMQSWDVVNEALKIEDGRPDGLRRTHCLEVIGPEYLDIAYHTARAADPKAKLVYNDYDLEMNTPDHAAKRRALLNLIDGFKKRGTPVDMVGVQSHLSIEEMPHFDPKVYSDFIKALADRGLEVMITEMDVVDRGAASDIAQRDRQIADVYRRYLDVALANPAMKAVITWGLTDKDSWITSGDVWFTRRKDGQKPRPLPFDVNYVLKPAYVAIAEALHGAPQRRTG